MDVYDFDHTLYRGDSTVDFFMFCARKYPRMLLTLPRTGIAAIACFGAKTIDKTRYKQALYKFLPHISDPMTEVERFWRVHEQRIAGPCKPRPGDVVISASPEFLLRGICEARELTLIASQVDPYTGAILGPNCSESEKVTRFRKRFGDMPIEHFYSDSLNDTPLARHARQAFLVQGDTITPWDTDV